METTKSGTNERHVTEAAGNTPTSPMPSTQNRVYRPDDRFADSALTALMLLGSEVYRFRSHIRTIFSQEFRNSYRGTRLGVFWNFALPLLPVSVYVFLASFRVFPSFDGVPGGLFVALGAAAWFFFAGCVQQPITVVQNRNTTAMKTSLPLSASIASSFARLIFETLVRLGLVIVLCIGMQVLPAALAPAAAIVFLLGAAFFLSIGLIAAILNVIWPDLQRVITVFLQYGIFVSGVIFPLSSLGPIAFFEWANPFAVFIAALRDVSFLGVVTNPIPLFTFTALTVVLVLLAARIFYVMEQRIRGVV